MKKAIFIALLALASTASAADVVCEGTRKLEIGDGVSNPTFSPDGSRTLFSTENFTGLKSLDIASGEVTVSDTSLAAGFNPVFSPDGGKVFFRRASFKDNLVYRDLVSYEFTTGKSKQLLKPTLERIVVAADAKAVRVRSPKGFVAGTNGKNARFVASNFETISVFDGMEQKEIKPLADSYTYEWASLSPDGKRILFSEPFLGIYVCGIDGSDAVKIAQRGAYPQWVNDDIVTIVVTKDDGYGILASRIDAVEISSAKSTTLTPDDVVATEMSVCPATRQMAYSTLDGKMYITNLVIR